MYVRWERRPRQSSLWRREGPAETLLCARLIESQRIDGKPRARVIAYLGSIRDRFLSNAGQRGFFWRQVGDRLDALGLAAGERASVEAAIHRVVARPTQEELDAGNQEIRRLESVIAQRR